jgi:hypothetical protein
MKGTSMMKRLLFGLLGTLLPACMTVDTPATDDEDTSTERALASDLDDWCDSTCARFGSCPERCDCAGDTCSCTGIDDDCAEDCREALGEYLGQGDDCAEAGRTLMRCIDRVDTCDELYAGVDCEPASTEAVCEDQRHDSGGDVSPTGPFGVTCSAGSGGGSAGSAGGANVPAFSCEERREQCSDGASYQVVCSAAGDGASCNCFRSGEFTGSLTLTPARCPSVAEMNAGCGWALAEDF